MTCGQRVSTPYGSGLIVALKGDESVIVALDDGTYAEALRVDCRPTSGYNQRVGSSDSPAKISATPFGSLTLSSGVAASRGQG